MTDYICPVCDTAGVKKQSRNMCVDCFTAEAREYHHRNRNPELYSTWDFRLSREWLKLSFPRKM